MLSLLDRWARTSPTSAALRDESAAPGWGDLARAVEVRAAAYRREGVRPGDRVQVVGRNGVDAVTALFAIWRSGAIAVVTDPQATTADREAAIEAGRAPAAAVGNDTAAVLFTSGSTGRPRGFALGHAALRENAALTAGKLSLAPGDHVVSFLPLAARMNLVALLANVAAGATTVLAPGLLAPDGSLGQALLGTGVRGFSAVPTTLRLLASRGFLTAAVMPGLGWIRVGAGPVTTADFERLSGSHPACALHLSYGLGETGEVAWQRGEDLDARRPGLVGKPLGDVAISVARSDGGVAPAGATGEIQVAGPRLLDGYLDEPARREPGAAFATGDLGAIETGGALVLHGRIKHIIKVAGESVSALSVERVLLAVTGVDEAVVVAAPDPLLGEVPVAFVIGPPGRPADPAAARAACAAALPPLAVPRRIHVVDALPRLASGKVDRAALAATARAETAESR